MTAKTGRYLLGLTGGLLAMAGSSAMAAEGTGEPFADWTVELGQAVGFETIGEFLILAGADGRPDAVAEIGDAVIAAAFERFAGTLAGRTPDLADAFRGAVDAIGEAVPAGEVPAADVEAALALWQQAYDTVIDPGLQADPQFRAALMADLLLLPGGVAEGYEDPAAYALGWAALERIRVLWSDLAPRAAPPAAAQVEENLAELAHLYPALDEVPRMVGIGTEDAEPGAQALVGALEVVVRADLYGARDLPGLANHLADVVEGACPAFAEDETAGTGIEAIYAVHDRYGDLAGVLDVFDPDLKATIEAAFDALGVAAEDDGPGGSGPPPGGAGSDGDAADGVTACSTLAASLRAAGTTLG